MGKAKQVELAVIGAGPGGYSAAFRASDLGKKVVLIDRDEHIGIYSVHKYQNQHFELEPLMDLCAFLLSHYQKFLKDLISVTAKLSLVKDP